MSEGLEPEKKSKGSFPSKYETVIYKRNIKLAFGTSTQRIIDLSSSKKTVNECPMITCGMSDQDEMPGPGSYTPQSSLNLIGRDNQESMSRKGLGVGFVSKNRRFNQWFDKNEIDVFYSKLKSTPGPGQYSPTSSTLQRKRPYSSASTSLSTPTHHRSILLNNTLT